MATLNIANTYFEAAQQRMKQGELSEAIKFFEKAANEYIDVSPQYADDPAMKRLIDSHIDDCLLALKPPPKKQKVAIGGGGNRGLGGRQQQDDEDLPKEYVPLQRPKERFANVAGLDYVKEQLLDALVNPYKLKEKFAYYGVKPPKGILLYGPSGCGKTYVVKAAAGEFGAAFFYIKLSEVVSKWVGDTEKNLEQVFKAAEANTPSIIMLDEMDAMAGDRSMQSGAYRQFVTQILQLLDGAETLKEGVFVIGATNLPWDMDPAIIRTGRLDKCILVPPPDLEARVAAFKIHCKNKHVADSVDFNRLGQESYGFTFSDIAAICNEAGMAVVKDTSNGPSRDITYEDIICAMKYEKDSSGKVQKRMRPSLSLISWLGKVKRSPKARDFPDLMKLVETFGAGNGKAGKPDHAIDDKPRDDAPIDADS